MTSKADVEGAWRDVSIAFGPRATRDPARLEACAWDFGGLVRRLPAIVVSVASDEDVLTAIRVATQHGLPISVRGSGHGQSGQCLADASLVLEMRGLGEVRIDAARRTMVADGGATWKRVLDRAFAEGQLPVAPTLVVDTTVAGTLSVGGVGSESFRYGAQVNNVISLDVATLDGRVVRCSKDEHQDLFDVVRGGLGQCGVILRAEYPLRPCKPRLRTTFLVYEDASRFVADLDEVCARPRSERVLGFMTRRGRSHVLMLALGNEFSSASEVDDRGLRRGLAYSSELPSADFPLWDESGIPGHLFFRVYTGTDWSEAEKPPRMLHPWVEHLLAPQPAAALLSTFLAHPPGPLAQGTCGIIPVAATGSRAPLFVRSNGTGDEELMIGVGMFSNIPKGLKKDALVDMTAYSRMVRTAGGKRYLSGFVEFESEPDWAEHYGDVWSRFRALKATYDPAGLLNPGFIQWPSPGSDSATTPLPGH